MEQRIDVPEAIQRFIARLRHDGISISPAETIDAVKAVSASDVEERDAFRLALRATLIKRHDDTPLFERAFAAFFAAPGSRRRGKGQRPGPGPSGEGSRSRTPSPPHEASPSRPGRIADMRRRIQAERSRPGRIRILVSERPPAIQPERPAPSRGPAPLSRGRGTSPAPPDAPRPAAPKGGPLVAPDARRLDLMRRISTEDEALLAAEVPRLVRRIRLRAGRRHQESFRGRPWPARLMRRSVSTGGVPFAIPMRRRRPRRASVVVLADVSWSVMRASALFLMIAMAFLRIRRRTAVHLFVDRCVEASDRLARWDRLGTRSFQALLEGVGDLDPRAPSDYGRAFWQAAFARKGAIRGSRRDTVMVVLGDARSNFRDPQVWAFEQLASRCKRVIWLLPEPLARWQTGDSVIETYMPHCDVVCEARDLDSLARGVEEILRSV